MDPATSDVMPAAAAPTSSNVVTMPLIHGKILWPEAPSIVQNFSLPPSIMYYMAKNPSTAKCYLKMVQSCKYFFEKLPVLIVRRFFGEDIDGGFNARICSDDIIKCIENNGKCCVKLDLNKHSSQIWLTNSLKIKNGITSMLCKKIYGCECFNLEFCNEVVMFDDFKTLASAAEIVNLEKSLIKYNDEKPVMLDKIVEVMPEIDLFRYGFPDDTSVATASTLTNIMKLSNFEKSRIIMLDYIPQIFAVEDLSAFIKKRHKIRLCFNTSISEEYMNQLDTLVDEIIESQVPNSTIYYHGQDPLKRSTMMRLSGFKFLKEEDSDEDDESDDEEHSDQ